MLGETLSIVFKMHPCAPTDVWGWDTVGTRIKGCGPSAHHFFGLQIHSLVGLGVGVCECPCYGGRGWFRSLCLWWDCVLLKFLRIYLPGTAITFLRPFYYRKITPRKPSLVITESFVSQHPHLPGTLGCMDWLLCFAWFPHLLPKAKVLPTQSATQYKQLLCLVLVGHSLGYVHKKIFLL